MDLVLVLVAVPRRHKHRCGLTLGLLLRYMEQSRRSIPLAQVRSLRNIGIKSMSFNAVDRFYSFLSTGEVQLAGRIPEVHYNLFMSLCRVCRLRFRLRGFSSAELSAVDRELETFAAGYYARIYWGTLRRLALWRSTVAAIMDIKSNLSSCGSAWLSWQLAAERNIGTLSGLINSHSHPCAKMVGNASLKYKADLISSIGEMYVPGQWTNGTGKVPQKVELPSRSLPLSPGDGHGQALLFPRCREAPLEDGELRSMRAVLPPDGVSVPVGEILAIQYFPFKFEGDGIAGSVPIGVDRVQHRRRKFLLPVNSSERRRAHIGHVQKVNDDTFGAVQNVAKIPPVPPP